MLNGVACFSALLLVCVHHGLKDEEEKVSSITIPFSCVAYVNLGS